MSQFLIALDDLLKLKVVATYKSLRPCLWDVPRDDSTSRRRAICTPLIEHGAPDIFARVGSVTSLFQLISKASDGFNMYYRGNVMCTEVMLFH